MENITADIVIAGGGTAGCVVAGRLNDAFPNLSIVIIENGPDSRGDPLTEQPLAGMFQVWKAPESDTTWLRQMYISVDWKASYPPGTSLAEAHVSIGWSSSLNTDPKRNTHVQAYQAAAKSDFDDWNVPGWSFDELLPTIKKTVRYEGPGSSVLKDAHGAMPISLGGYTTKFGPHVETAFQGTDTPLLHDMADFKTGHGLGRTAKWIGKDGYRSTAARHYLFSKDRPNVTILCRKTVSKVLIEDGKAVGVEICNAPTDRGDTEVKNVSVIRAREQVVVSAGALGSPAILERSGLGDPEVLQKVGVQVQVDLPGVGKEYQDHQSLVQSFKVQDLDGLDRFARQEPEVLERAQKDWTENGTGILATSLIDYYFKLRPTEEELKQIGPEYSSYWEKVGKDKTDKPLVSGAMGLMYLGDYSTIELGHYMSIAHWLNYPQSKGSIHINTSNPHVQPTFDTGMLSGPGDIGVHKWAYKLLRDAARRLPCYLGEEASRQPSYPPHSPAAVAHSDTPKTLEDVLDYTDEDDKAIEAWIKLGVKTTWHSMATCPMKARESGGVVDAKLNVYGVEGLKVADLSICPSNVGCNTASVALIIGEKCAEIIEQELASRS